jgi:hypothetical protein
MKEFNNDAKYTSLTKNVVPYSLPVFFETNTFVIIKKIVSSGNVMSCILVEIYQYIKRNYCFYIQGKRISFYTEDGSNKFLHNTSKYYIMW